MEKVQQARYDPDKPKELIQREDSALSAEEESSMSAKYFETEFLKPAKGTIIHLAGHEIEDPALKKVEAGEYMVEHWLKEGYNVITLSYPKGYPTERFQDFFNDVLSFAGSRALPFYLTGHSFGAGIILDALCRDLIDTSLLTSDSRIILLHPPLKRSLKLVSRIVTFRPVRYIFTQ